MLLLNPLSDHPHQSSIFAWFLLSLQPLHRLRSSMNCISKLRTVPICSATPLNTSFLILELSSLIESASRVAIYRSSRWRLHLCSFSMLEIMFYVGVRSLSPYLAGKCHCTPSLRLVASRSSTSWREGRAYYIQIRFQSEFPPLPAFKLGFGLNSNWNWIQFCTS